MYSLLCIHQHGGTLCSQPLSLLQQPGSGAEQEDTVKDSPEQSTQDTEPAQQDAPDGQQRKGGKKRFSQRLRPRKGGLAPK